MGFNFNDTIFIKWNKLSGKVNTNDRYCDLLRVFFYCQPLWFCFEYYSILLKKINSLFRKFTAGYELNLWLNPVKPKGILRRLDHAPTRFISRRSSIYIWERQNLQNPCAEPENFSGGGGVRRINVFAGRGGSEAYLW